MIRKLLPLFFTILLGAFAGRAFAANYTCTLGSPTGPSNFTATYSATSNAVAALTVDVTCVRTGGVGNNNFTATVTPNHGLYFSGTQNKGANGTDRVNYDLYTDATCTTLWTSSVLNFTAPPAGGQTRTATYYGCVPSAQPLRPPAAVYTDTVSLALTTSRPQSVPAGTPKTFAVNITVPAICTISPVPGTVAFGTYVAFGSALTTNTTFGMTCNQTLTYGLDIGATAGGVVGGNSLYYTLGLSTTSSGGSNPLNGRTGNGLVQTYYINGTMPAGQAGTCAAGTCANQTETRTLTVTY
jgi:spore coat protein U-like protein